MMIQAFYTGLSGMKTNQKAIDTLSDNIANISTVGFRKSVSEFSSLFEATLNLDGGFSTLNSSVGAGVKVDATQLSTATGTLLASDKSTDVAIDGDGWFGIQANGEPLYTRDGTFSFDVNRDLVTQDGFHVLGTVGTNIVNGIVTNPLPQTPLGDVATQEKLTFPESLIFPPTPTTKVTFNGNLGIVDEIRKMSSLVVDAQNNRNTLSLEFTKSATQPSLGVAWDVVATIKSADGQTPYDTQSGTISFDEKGALTTNTLGVIDNNGSPVQMDLGIGYGGITALDNSIIDSSSSSDGKVGGELIGYDINVNGDVLATFTNSEQISVGRIAVFHFQNDKGLQRVSGTRFEESSNSGKPIFFQDVKGQNILGASLHNFKLESSNVELASGLTELIVLQRSYDANAKSITTADQMIQKALSMHK